jgi:nudix-type nucleoside diphosphatase (YffH/AdpP family)
MSVFIYGSLQDDVLRGRLLGRNVPVTLAHLPGYEVREHKGAPLPAIVPAAGGITHGLLLNDLSTAEMARLDAYELPFDYKPVAVDVHVGDTIVTTQVYLPGPSVDVSDRLWSLARWQDQMGPISREMAVEIGSFDPPMAGDALLSQWHMISLRASVRLRARAENTPANVRFQPSEGDVTLDRGPTYAGDFFRLASFDVSHRTFTYETAGPLPREVFLGADAAIILPYDPKTDRVLLVEQLRMGPLMRGTTNPWILEPIAGMVDAGETPEQAALRESHEEAGLEGITLEKMFAYYPTTGGSSDYFYCFAGTCDLPEPTTYTGGLAHEAEDLRLHVMSFADAFALIDTGEANMGALVTMLLWLSQNRARLRSTA